MKKAEQNNAIKVFCKMRPLNALEKSTGGNCCIDHTDKTINVTVRTPSSKSHMRIITPHHHNNFLSCWMNSQILTKVNLYNLIGGRRGEAS